MKIFTSINQEGYKDTLIGVVLRASPRVIFFKFTISRFEEPFE